MYKIIKKEHKEDYFEIKIEKSLWAKIYLSFVSTISFAIDSILEKIGFFKKHEKAEYIVFIINKTNIKYTIVFRESSYKILASALILFVFFLFFCLYKIILIIKHFYQILIRP